MMGVQQFVQQLRWLWWRMLDGDVKLVQHVLRKNCVVVDCGGYVGEWSQEMCDRYDPALVLVFEPQEKYYDMCVRRFRDNECVKVECVALGCEEGVVTIGEGMGARVGAGTQLVRRCLLSAYVAGLVRVDCLKMNIEGAEVDVLRDLVVHDQLGKIQRVLVQLHDDDWGCVRELLEETHDMEWGLKNVWGCWVRRKDGGGCCA